MTTDPLAAPPALPAFVRWLLMALAWLCVLLGVVGIILPVLPTVPFLLVAAWAASRSSPRLHRWLHTHPSFGHLLLGWERHGAVPRAAKWAATVMMAFTGVLLCVVVPQGWTGAVLAAMLVMAAGLYWLWRRPEQRPRLHQD
jgi:uncharacterized membrane protein YbaN (DUF454 family)